MEKSISWLEKLLGLQGLQTSVSGTRMTGDLGDDSFWLTIDAKPLTDVQVKGLIGERGQVLDAIQYLANTTLNMGQQADAQQSYTIEIDGYRKQRQAELKAIADEAAKQVMTSSQEYEVKGLSAAERRQLHGLLGEHEQLETFSRGREPDRHLVVKLVSAGDTADDTVDDDADDADE